MDYQVKIFCEIIKEIVHPSREKCIDKEIDWDYLVQLSKEHNLLALFMEGASKYYSYISRNEYEREMKESLGVVAGQVRRTTAFLQLYEAFNEAGIYPIVMKGLICRELYGKMADHRPSGDEDILIRISEYEEAKRILIENSYVSELSAEAEKQIERLQEVSFIHPKNRLHIELHLNPMGRENDSRASMSDYFVNVFDEYREVEIQDILVRTMNHQEHMLFLILHAFKHFTFGGFGVRQMLDILLYQEQYGKEIDFEKLHQILSDFKADTFWSDLIHIGNLYFGFDLNVIQEQNCPEELLDDMIRCGAFGNKTQAEVLAGRATMRASSNYLKDKSSNVLVVIWRSIFPSRVYMLDQAPYLQEKPWLLPIAWIKRWFCFIKKERKDEENLAFKSIQISQRRMKLLKKYDLV